MSVHYTLHLSIILKKSLSDEDIATLDFLVDGKPKPSVLPPFPCFSDPIAVGSRPLTAGYSSFFPGEYVCTYWKTDLVVARSGINLILPSIKDLQGWWEILRLVDWLCSISEEDGLIGYMVEEDDPVSITLLYSFNGKLYFHDKKDLKGLISFTTGEPPTEPTEAPQA